MENKLIKFEELENYEKLVFQLTEEGLIGPYNDRVSEHHLTLITVVKVRVDQE